jgi:chemotaxis signal transduction protein/LysM repeat protein
MKKVLVITIDGNRYGIWKDDVLSVREVNTIYGLPQSPEWFAGIARIDDRTAHLVDIAVLIGHRPFDRNRSGCVLIMNDGTSIEGFIADSEDSRIDVPDGSTFPMPDYLACYGIDMFVLDGSELLPIIKIKDVYEQLRSENTPLPACTLNISTLQRGEEDKSRDFCMFTIHGDNYAVTGDLIERSDTCSHQLSSLPSAPDHVEGVVYDSGGVRAILDPGKRIGYRHSCDGGTVMFVKDGGPGFRVGSDAMTFSGCTPVVLPPLAASALMQFALLKGHDIIPVLDVHALVSVDTRYRKKKYTLRSRFHQHFGTKEVSVLEFTLSDMVIGLPYSQVEDILDAVPFRTLRKSNPLLLGIAERNGELLPVLSLSPCFARTALPSRDLKMILLKNGNFRVLLLAGTVLDRRSLLPDEQKALPINLPYRYVYGCYTDENSVRIILDVATIAMYAGEGKVREDIRTLMEKFVATGSRETKRTVPISCGNMGNDDQTTIAHTEEDAELSDPHSVSNNEFPVTEDRVIVRPVNADVTVETTIKGDDKDPAGSTHAVRKDRYAATPDNENDDLNKDDELPEAPKDEEITVDFFEKEETEKRETGPVGTDDGMEKCPVDDKNIVKIESRSMVATNWKGMDVSEGRSSGRDLTYVAGERDDRAVPDKERAVSERDNNERLKVGEGSSVDPCDAYAGCEKEEKEGSPALSGEITARKRDNTDVSGHIVNDTIGTHDDIDEALTEKGSGNVDMSSTDPRPVKSIAARRGKGSYAILAMGICTVLMVLLTYFVIVPPHTDETEKSGTGDPQDTVFEESTNVNGSEKAFSTANDVTSDRKVGPITADNSSVRSISGTPVAVPETPRSADNDATSTSATKAGNGNEGLASATITQTGLYVVEKGDTLWDIAEQFTGDPFNYKMIAVDNDIGNPDLIFPGQRIVIKIEVPEEDAIRSETSP